MLIVFELFDFEHCKISILGYVCREISTYALAVSGSSILEKCIILNQKFMK